MENWFKKQKQLELCVLPQFTLTEEWFLITYRYTEDEGNGNPSDTLYSE